MNNIKNLLLLTLSFVTIVQGNELRQIHLQLNTTTSNLSLAKAHAQTALQDYTKLKQTCVNVAGTKAWAEFQSQQSSPFINNQEEVLPLSILK